MSLIKVAETSDIPNGNIKSFTVSGKRIAIANVNGQFFAIDDTCTHAQCSLGDEGILDGSTIICGCHGASFDVASGKVLSLPAPKDVESYKVKVRQGNILVDF